MNKNTFIKLKNKIFRKLLKYSWNPRPSSFPFITGDSFRALADHLFDETQKLDPKKVRSGQIIFVKSDMLQIFFETTHKEIDFKYILISHNSDENIDERYLKYIDNKIIHWFAQNCLINHPKISSIPIGLDNLYFSYFGDTSFYKKIMKKNENIFKKNKILFGFSVHTNKKERGVAIESLRKTSVAKETKGFIPFHKYISRELIKYKFVASPPGNGIDSPRQWQAMYLKTIPILKENENTDHFIKSNLPILKVQNWNELTEYTEEDLEKKYASITRSSKTNALWMDYWINKINKYKNYEQRENT